MNYRVVYVEDVETGIYTYIVQKRKWLVFWEGVDYADNERDAYKKRNQLLNGEVE